ncbi:MAG: nucleotidyl transferase AbiEii/AbiGii toxin family protein [Candidatus Nanopelagicales bacterium]|nr:nucleotidyl transferase AbiEii/AbiGii toxin family protein [Candidatus Nanopelagicales bacterium]
MKTSLAVEPWEKLFDLAVSLIDQVSLNAKFEWSFGGGTVLMFKLNHRRSKDIDIFIADQQLLGMFSPRLHDYAQALTSSYSEDAQAIKLQFPMGEIDFIVAEPLVQTPFEKSEVRGRLVLLETPAEIIAKKLWHRGHIATGRDLFDLAAVATHNPGLLEDAKISMRKNADTFLHQCRVRERVIRAQYEAIDTLDFHLTYNESMEIADSVLTPLISSQ